MSSNLLTDRKAIDISGIDKFELLEALWYATKFTGSLANLPLDMLPTEFDKDKALKDIQDIYGNIHVGFVMGKCINMQIFETDLINTYWMYDYDSGQEGTFEKVVNELKNKIK